MGTKEARMASLIYRGRDVYTTAFPLQHPQQFFEVGNVTAAIHFDGPKAYVVFAGTDPTEWGDVKDDIRACKVSFLGDRKRRVHRGFYEHAMDVWPQIWRALITANHIKHVSFIGHSLGGAAATVCAAAQLNYLSNFKVSLVTFGCPRVGNKAFSKWLSDKLAHNYRYVNSNDVVARVPKLFYHHVGKPLFITHKGRIVVHPCKAFMLKDRIQGAARDLCLIAKSVVTMFLDPIQDHSMVEYIGAVDANSNRPAIDGERSTS